ncbi:hypothetical protein [Deinococcus marmoris]|uniref:DUF2303 family protein n=1 Tax=Deinococcus marmoris TaxID=249408 RepID=A0A1U7P4U7_9DEIO|nr:hypothetical protein [Deinococcus marmoris]OLV20180.1 hypothetical protein BOO71_0000568 [Deinococcus marmoris]
MSHLDSTAIQDVERLTKEANGILIEDARPGSTHLIRNQEGEPYLFVVELDHHNTTVFDLPSLKITAEASHEAGVLEAIYVSDGQIVALCEDDDIDQRFTAVLNLPLHPAFVRVASWKQLTALTQKELTRLLRTELRDHVDPTVIDTFSALKFTNNREQTSEVRPASNALDSSIRQSVADRNGGSAPEVIKLNVPVYDIPDARGDLYEVNVYVEFDHDAGKFLLLTVHGDLRAAQEEAVSALIADLKDHAQARWPVLYGKPS